MGNHHEPLETFLASLSRDKELWFCELQLSPKGATQTRKHDFHEKYALDLRGALVIPLSSCPRGKAVWLVTQFIRIRKSTLLFKPGGRKFWSMHNYHQP